MKPTTLKPLALAGLVAAMFAGCATTGTTEALEAARIEVGAAATNPDVIARAPLELRTAQEALDRASNLARNGESTVEVDHHAYLAQVRAQTARDLAMSRRSTDEMTRVQGEVDRLRLAARTQEANIARSQAAQSQMAADAARAQAAASGQQAAIASQQARAATQEAAIERDRANLAAADAAAAKDRLRVLVVELQARETERGLLVTLGDVLFATGRAELLPVALPRMDKLAGFLNQFPDKQLLIEGYTDAVGSDAMNRELSMRRADAVKSALVQRGVNPARMVAQGYGESFPVATNASPEGRAMNRRVEVVVTDDRGNLKPRG